MGGALRALVSFVVVAAAGWATARDEWPWRRPIAAEVTVPVIRESHDTLKPGEALGALFRRNGLVGLDLRTLVPSLDPRRVPAGMVFRFLQPEGDSLPTDVLVRTSSDQRVRLLRTAAGWTSTTEPVRWSPEVLGASGRIDRTLYDALDGAVPEGVLGRAERARLAWALADVFAWQLDMSRDLQPGDRLRVLYERETSDEGEVRVGRVLAAELVNAGRPLRAFRFDDAGRGPFFDEEGGSLRRAFLKAPLAFHSITSNFSRGRLHPVLGVVRAHEGIDYGAAPSTPVVAAGDGLVLRAGWAGGYGRLVELRHANGVVTRYAHLQSIAAAVRPGGRVHQGQTIGAVGSSGLSTGPHLHYEFRVGGVARDPRTVDVARGEPVPPEALERFRLERDRLAAELERLPLDTGRLTS